MILPWWLCCCHQRSDARLWGYYCYFDLLVESLSISVTCWGCSTRRSLMAIHYSFAWLASTTASPTLSGHILVAALADFPSSYHGNEDSDCSTKSSDPCSNHLIHFVCSSSCISSLGSHDPQFPSAHGCLTGQLLWFVALMLWNWGWCTGLVAPLIGQLLKLWVAGAPWPCCGRGRWACADIFLEYSVHENWVPGSSSIADEHLKGRLDFACGSSAWRAVGSICYSDRQDLRQF